MNILEVSNMDNFIELLSVNKEWLFSGLAVSIIGFISSLLIGKVKGCDKTVEKNSIKINGDVHGKVLINNKSGHTNVLIYLFFVLTVFFLLLIMCSSMAKEPANKNDSPSDRIIETTQTGNLMLSNSKYNKSETENFIISAGEAYLITNNMDEDASIVTVALENTKCNYFTLGNNGNSQQIFRNVFRKVDSESYNSLSKKCSYAIELIQGKIALKNAKQFVFDKLDHSILFECKLGEDESFKYQNDNNYDVSIYYETEEKTRFLRVDFAKTGEEKFKRDYGEIKLNTFYSYCLGEKERTELKVISGNLTVYGSYFDFN